MNNKNITPLVFAMGLTAVAWVAWGFVGTSPLALLVTAVIAGVYVLGAAELWQYRAATVSLAAALDDIPQPMTDLDAWLTRLPSSLQNPVRQRIEGVRVALPGPALTPYLVGLLVMLGMLGTFLGMVVTFKGAVFALEGSADLEIIRSALAAPIKGLGLSFGTSVAGVATSAALGMLSALCRSERHEAVRLLDTRVATVLRPFSPAQQRHDTFLALQAQAQAMPLIADHLQRLTDAVERRHSHLSEQLLTQQQVFQQEAATAYTQLADRVGTSLNQSLSASTRLAGDTLRPMVEQAMASLVLASQHAHQQMADTAQAQWLGLSQGLAVQWQDMSQGLSAQWSGTAEAVSRTWAQALYTQSQTQTALVDGLERTLAGFTQTFEQRASAVLASLHETAAQSQRAHGERMDQLAAVWRNELNALRDTEALRGQAAVDRLDALQTAMAQHLDQLQSGVAQHLTQLGTSLEAPMTRMLQTASDVPQAAAEVIARLKQEMTALAERDNQALAERTALTEKLGTLLQSVQESAALGTASAVELSSLGESFSHGVGLFNSGNEKLMVSLQRIESALGQSLTRSDEQLAYYVAQAREVIDLSITSQQGIVEDLRRLHSQAATQGVAG